ncbi:MAG: hypothetical protein Q8R28_23595, partial [Dehalococcoidia bacterium]|nr:hypothetical protein [Dehalococcoidia bacterium]
MRVARLSGPVIVLLLVGLVMVGSVAALNAGKPEGEHIPQAPAAMVIPASAPTPTPTPDPNNGAAPRLWDFAVVDGNCDDPVYAQAGSVVMRDAQGTGATEVRLFHSGSDLYLCTGDMPPGDGQRLLILVDADASRGKLPIPGDYAFVIPIKGAVQVLQGSLNGGFVAITAPTQDVQAVVGGGGGQTWRTEARISLEWLGGYARVDAFDLALVGAGESVLQQWPQKTNYLSPFTWGDLTLAPIYGSVSAGSVYLDGESYLAVPYTPALSPQEITIEAWVKPADGACGTLVGN